MARHVQVAIIGGGPVGMALAVDLGQRGISCAVVERHLAPQRIPKGQNLNQRSLEHFYFWNCAEELRAARIAPPDYPTGGITVYGSLLGDHWFIPGGGGRQAGRSLYFQAGARLPQYLTEEVLRKRVSELPVTCLFGMSAKKIEQDGDFVRATIANDGWPYEEEVIEADYLVGCDGARSLVREEMGIDRVGTDFDQRMVLLVLRSRDLHEALKRFPDLTTYTVLHPELRGARYFFGRVDVGEGWFFHAPVPRDATADNFDFVSLLQRAAGFPAACEIDHVGFFELRIAVASRYRQGRVFIAGDAAHSHPPYGAYGLNTGLEDIANLGWKLTAALRGWGSDGLLDSYSEERQPIFAETGEQVIAAGIRNNRALLERFSPDRDLKAFEQAWKDFANRREEDGDYEPHYEGSSVVHGPPGATIGIRGRRSFAAQPGHHLAPQLLSSGRNVFEELGPGFTLLAFGVPDQTVQGFQDAADAARIPLSVVRDTFEDGRKDYESRLILVRPDQYVAWSNQEEPSDASQILSRVIGGS